MAGDDDGDSYVVSEGGGYAIAPVLHGKANGGAAYLSFEHSSEESNNYAQAPSNNNNSNNNNFNNNISKRNDGGDDDAVCGEQCCVNDDVVATTVDRAARVEQRAPDAGEKSAVVSILPASGGAHAAVSRDGLHLWTFDYF
jgi:hypothetical protein